MILSSYGRRFVFGINGVFFEVCFGIILDEVNGIFNV